MDRPLSGITPRKALVPALLVAPLVLFLAAFFLVPLGEVVVMSFTEPKPTLDHYRNFFTDTHLLGVLGMTFVTALVVTLCTLAAGYPLAYAMVRLGGGLATTLVAVVAMSFWTSYLVRSYAWMVILGTKGPISGTLGALGWTPPPQLLFTRFSSTLAMVHVLLPFMVMALYSVMRKIDPAYGRAAQSLGAPPLAAFRHVFLPLSAPAIVNGCTLVFITCLGFYVIPALLGSPREQMIAGMIGHQIEEMIEFGEASAMAVVLLAVTMLVFWLYNRFVGLDKLWG